MFNNSFTDRAAPFGAMATYAAVAVLAVVASPARLPAEPLVRPAQQTQGAGEALQHATGTPSLQPHSSDLDSLVALALARNPTISAAEARVDAARARVAPAGARPDPMLMAGVQNLPVSEPGFSDLMTMKMVGISQHIPYPGKLRLGTRAAEEDALAARAQADAASLDVVLAVKNTYYDLAFTDRALEIVRRNQAALASLSTVAQTRYAGGTGAQSDVLRVRTEMAQLGDEAATLLAARHSALARLNAALDRPSDTPVGPASFPAYLVRAAVADSAEHVHFTSSTLGARAADSPILALDSLQTLALLHNPMIEEHEARIAAQAARVELARKATLPDFDVSLEYGQRQGQSDMVSAIVSIPIPLQKSRKQEQESAANRAELTALEAEHRSAVNELRSEIAARVSDLERARTQLALSVKAMIPQARATLASTTAGYQVGQEGFESVIDAQAGLFAIETSYWRALADFGRALAALEHTVGSEVLR